MKRLDQGASFRLYACRKLINAGDTFIIYLLLNKE